jgi:hypothetical protein
VYRAAGFNMNVFRPGYNRNVSELAFSLSKNGRNCINISS